MKELLIYDELTGKPLSQIVIQPRFITKQIKRMRLRLDAYIRNNRRAVYLQSRYANVDAIPRVAVK